MDMEVIMIQPSIDTYVKVRLDRKVFTELELYCQLRNIPKSSIASIAIKQLLENDKRWQMKQFFYAPNNKPKQPPVVGKRVKIACYDKHIPHFANIMEALVVQATDGTFKFFIDFDLAKATQAATIHGEGMDLQSGRLVEPEEVEATRCIFELPNEYVWAVE
jgi:hypothetical protein